MFINLISPVFRNIFPSAVRTFVTSSYQQPFKSILSSSQQGCLTSPIKPQNSWSLDFIRTNVRNHFPYPREHKRKKHGFHKRMATKSGRAILMRRILKGRHVLSH